MKRTLISYKTKPGLADTNAALIAAVFAELKAARPKAFVIFRCGSTTTVSCIWSKPGPMPPAYLRI